MSISFARVCIGQRVKFNATTYEYYTKTDWEKHGPYTTNCRDQDGVPFRIDPSESVVVIDSEEDGDANNTN